MANSLFFFSQAMNMRSRTYSICMYYVRYLVLVLTIDDGTQE